jgi:GH24 family phage-related lysozyme (muramidase)
MTDLAQVLIERFEECRLESYLDTRGIPTIAWGHTGSDVYYPGQTCSQEQADMWLQNDMALARYEAGEFPYFNSLNDVRQAVLVSMCYQMGTDPLHWPHFMAALGVEDYTEAADAGRDSDWWRTETPARAELEMKMLETGVYQP